MSINFHGAAGQNQRILVQEKIEEIKKKVADYYFDPDCKVIAIPNHYVMPKKPTVLGKKGKKNQDDQILDKHCEELLHHELVNTAREAKMESFILNSFQSGDSVQQLVQKGKHARGKDSYAEFNKHELRVKEILGIEDVEEEKLKSCIDEHLKWRQNPLEFQDSENWLFKKESLYFSMKSFCSIKFFMIYLLIMIQIHFFADFCELKFQGIFNLHLNKIETTYFFSCMPILYCVIKFNKKYVFDKNVKY